MIRHRLIAMQTLWAVFLLFLMAAHACADTLYLADGRRLKGLVLEEYVDRLLFKTYVDEAVYLRNGIDEIFYDEPESNFLYLARRALASGDLVRGQGFLERALRVNPFLSIAREGLARVWDLQAKSEYKGIVSSKTLREQLGIRIKRDGDDIVVDRIVSGGPMEAAGVREGDILIRVFDIPCRYQEKKTVMQTLVGPPDTPAIVTIQREAVHAFRSGNRFQRAAPWHRGRLDVEMNYEGVTVKKGSPDQDLLVGDRIVSIAGQDTRYMPIGNARRLLNKSGRKVIIFHRTLTTTRR